MKINVLSTTLTCIAAGSLMGQATFPDNYWGGNPTHSAYEQDVIGEDSVFNLTQGTVSYDALSNTLNVQVHGNYFDDILRDDSDLLGTTMGDLFISTDGLSWETGGSATLDDHFGAFGATTWEYAAQLGTYDNASGQLDGRDSSNPLSGNLYSVDEGNIRTSEVERRGIYRKDQEWQYDGAGQQAESAFSWYIAEDSSFLNIALPNFTDQFGSTGELGFHWTMSCGNDVLEFEYAYGGITPVPEPTTIGLIGVAGMIGLVLVRRRLRGRRAERAEG